MSPPINIDGTDITGGTIDGTDFSVVTVDGTTVFGGIPNSGLQHRYDATNLTGNDGDPIGTWADETSNSDDLTQTSTSNPDKRPTLRTNGINGKQILEFDGSDDFLNVDYTDISQPFQIYIVAKHRTTNSNDVLDGFGGGEHRLGVNAGNFRLFSGGSNESTGPTDDTNSHIFTTTWRVGSNGDRIRVDGTDYGNKDTGDNKNDGLTVGKDADTNEEGSYDVGEIIVYDTELSTTDRDEVEDILSNKWGITI